MKRNYIIILSLIFLLSACVSKVEKGNYKIENGLELVEQLKPLEAISEFNKALKYQPENALIYYYMGNSYEELRQTEEAIDAYKKAVQYNKDYKEAYFKLGLIYEKTGQHGEFHYNFDKAFIHYFRNMSWEEAFLEMHNQLKISYAFGDWKKIDWDELFNNYSVQVSQAQTNNDTTAYQLALREYIYSIPDSHVSIKGSKMDSLKNQNTGGSLGFSIIGLDNNKIIINDIVEKGPAFEAGMKWGAEILTWNEQPINIVLKNTAVLWAEAIPSTLEVKKLEQYRLLPFSARGSEVKITYINPNTKESKSVVLTSEVNKYSYYSKQISIQGYYQKSGRAVHSEILENDIGYIWVRDESSDSIMPKVQEAMNNFKDSNIRGLIFDARNNAGGADELVPELTGYFFDKKAFYEHITWYNPVDKTFDIIKELHINPKSPYLDIPIVVLINEKCMSSGEGIPMALKKRPNTTVLGFYGTSGIFGMSMGNNITMPENVNISFPLGQSLNEDKVIQLDSDYSLNGGILPDIRIPMNYKNAYSSFVEKKDVLMEEAIKILLNE